MYGPTCIPGLSCPSPFLRLISPLSSDSLCLLHHLTRSNSSSVQFSSVAQSCPTLCNPMNPSTPGLPVHHQLPESTQTQVLQVGDAIRASHPLLSRKQEMARGSEEQEAKGQRYQKTLESWLNHTGFCRLQ